MKFLNNNGVVIRCLPRWCRDDEMDNYECERTDKVEFEFDDINFQAEIVTLAPYPSRCYSFVYTY